MKLKRSTYISPIIALLVWIVWYLYTKPQTISLIQENWQISLTMVFGSFIAGATSGGGGAVAFPVLTKVLEIPALDAKIFSLAIQSIGMTSATLAIIAQRINIEWRVILWASLGGISGIVTGSILLTPLLAPDLVKILFTTLMVSFALTLVVVYWQKRTYHETLIKYSETEKVILLFAGFFGGLVSGLVGSGIDIICFSVMVLLFRIRVKVATPTSVVLMAINSIIGFGLYYFVLDGFTVQIENYWLAAVPVVVVGGPLGAYFCSKLNGKMIGSILVFLIIVEFITSLLIIPLTAQILIISSMVLVTFLIVYYAMLKISTYQTLG